MLPEKELTQADLSDARLNHRLRRLVDAFTAHDDPLVEEWRQAIEDYRRQVDQEPNIP
jgi:hypothetical protein